jgi:hypothetical protein
MANMATDSPTELPFTEYQLLPIDDTMGNFLKSPHPDHSEICIPNYRILDTVCAPSFKERRLKYWGCNHQSNVSLRSFKYSTDRNGQMIDQRGANSLDLYRDVPNELAARRHYNEEILPTATKLPIQAESFNVDHALDNAVRCRTCETKLGEHLVTTANSLKGDGPPVRGRVIKFHRGALFNATSHSLLPALVFGTKMQSTNALNITAIVSDAVHTSVPLQMNWAFVALSLLMLAIMQSVYCLHPDRVQFSLSNVTMALVKRACITVCTTASETFRYITIITHQAKKVDRCCGSARSKWGKVGRQCSTTSSMTRLTKTYNTQYNVQTLLYPACVTSHAKRTGDDKPVAGYGSAANPILSYSGREPGLNASIHRVRCDFTEAVMTHAEFFTTVLSWVLPTMITVGARVTIYHGGSRMQSTTHTSHSGFDRLRRVWSQR